MLHRPDLAAGPPKSYALAKDLQNCIAPAAEAFCLPPQCYAEEAVLQAEIETFFRRKWIGIGHSGRFKAAGDYEALEVGGVPLIVIRGKDGVLRAFANSCRHRGARLLDGEGNCRNIRCPFHSWGYKLDGRLIGVPHMEDAAGFDKADYGLTAFRAAELGGFAFVCLNDATPSLSEEFGNFAKIHSPWPLNNLVPTRRHSFEVRCNWKSFLDVFNEYYHLPYVHRDSIDGVYNRPEVASPARGAYASQFGATDGTGGLLEHQQDHALPAMSGLEDAASKGVRYTWLFPNMTFAAASDSLWIYEANPIDARSCRVTQTICFPQEVTEWPDFEARAKHYYHRLDAAIAEDIPVLENQQRGLNSPFAVQGRFSPHLEANVAAFAKWYAGEMLAADHALSNAATMASGASS
ncbi:aromatic ring-hydroxylating dioxygenase subunit alpha [Pelagibius sp. Alg239-R121]|uniref:aromatic ring-hydroxylating oxygenase subunit alpha n=1 Tax=Pelagibius sp. Alg239-R121 TaxID=2993448 RepID=UPI0024A760DA|nr:aromatic ring-hydroxylating dioxygenase subunit alpha [Pelagibius sp. Alg239-R121]